MIIRNILVYDNIHFQYPKGELNGIELMVDTAPHGARFIEE